MAFFGSICLGVILFAAWVICLLIVGSWLVKCPPDNVEFFIRLAASGIVAATSFLGCVYVFKALNNSPKL